MLRDGLVCGIRNESIQKKLLSGPELTLKSAIEISVTMETAARDAIELQAKHGSTSTSVNKLTRKGQFGGKQRKPFSSRSGKPGRKCFRCNGTEHELNNCYYKIKSATSVTRRDIQSVYVRHK